MNTEKRQHFVATEKKHIQTDSGAQTMQRREEEEKKTNFQRSEAQNE